jgi:acetyltransferase-like isoleucine patch superfamily enzyme
MVERRDLAAKIDSKRLEELRELYEALRTEMKSNWNRDLPFEELLFDRWERARELGFGEGTSIYHNSYVYGDVTVGKNTWIGPFTILDGSGQLEIGSNCSISSGVQIYTHDTVMWALSEGKAEYVRSRVRIGDSCYIGSQTVITKGVSIGDHSVVGALSLVNKDIPHESIATGVPATLVGKVLRNKEGRIELSYQVRS